MPNDQPVRPPTTKEDGDVIRRSALSERISRLWAHPTAVGIQLGSVLILLSAGAMIGLHLGKYNPVPTKILSQVAFPIYYPRNNELPTSYTLDTASFKVADAQKDAVVYAITFPGGKLIVSDQPKPSADELSNFVHNYIPINQQVLTQIGTATIGQIGNQAVASLPTNENAWIIVTAPATMYGSDPLKQVLKSFIAPR